MIAVAYSQTTPANAALYGGLIPGLIESIRTHMPKQEILLIADDETPIMAGFNAVLRVPRVVPLMTWRLKCHQVAHEVADEILFTEPDVRFAADVMPVFDQEFDIAVTTREPEVTLAKRNTPYTLGATFSRSQAFWREAKMYCQSLPAEDQEWTGDMFSVAHVIDRGDFGVVKLDGAVFNHVVNDPTKPTDAKVLHYKGFKRKSWLFPLASEAA